jgi:hypothetical protein
MSVGNMVSSSSDSVDRRKDADQDACHGARCDYVITKFSITHRGQQGGHHGRDCPELPPSQH